MAELTIEKTTRLTSRSQTKEHKRRTGSKSRRRESDYLTCLRPLLTRWPETGTTQTRQREVLSGQESTNRQSTAAEEVGTTEMSGRTVENDQRVGRVGNGQNTQSVTTSRREGTEE